MASSKRTTDILVGQIHLADVVGIARKNMGVTWKTKPEDLRLGSEE